MNVQRVLNAVRTGVFLAVCFLSFILPRTVLGLPQTPSSNRPLTTNLCCKDPKLSDRLATLLTAVGQQPGSVSPSAGNVHARIDLDSLPKVIRDTLHSGQMFIDSRGQVQVYIECEEASSEDLRSITGLGITIELVGGPTPNRKLGEVYSSIPTIQALVPVNQLRALRNLAFVRYIRLPDYGLANTGSVDTQGDAVLQAQLARSTLGLDGTGINVGVISSGIAGVFATGCTTGCGPTSNVPSPITLGDLPAASGNRNPQGVLMSASGGITALSYRTDQDLEDTTDGVGGAEGTALLEIVHDLSPGATLYFANSDTGMAFESAVSNLATYCDVVVDDKYFLTPPYDGTSSVSANTSGVLNDDGKRIRAYITSAGNLAQNHYAGAYVSSGVDGTSVLGSAGYLQLFQSSPDLTTDTNGLGPEPFDPILVVAPGSAASVFLSWDDPTGGSTNDYDLFLVPLTCGPLSNGLPTAPCSIAGHSLISSKNPQTGTQNPTESLVWTNDTNQPITVGIVIQNVGNAAAVRTFDLFVGSPGQKETRPNHNYNTVSSSVPAQSDAGGSPVSVISAGAIDQSQCQNPGNCLGSVEPYSSQGPTQQTPQAPSRTKPDVIATDDVCITGAGGFGDELTSNSPPTSCPVTASSTYAPKVFRGTSAAAPHFAAIAALTLQAAPCLLSHSANPLLPPTARQNLSVAILETALPLPGIVSVEPATPNNVEGYGLADALAATMKMLPTATAGTSQTVDATSGQGASAVLAPLTSIGADPNNCPLIAVKWTGDCGSGSAASVHPSINCPIGINSVYVSVSNNGVSFSQPTTAPYTVDVTDFTLGASPTSATVSAGTPGSFTVNIGPSPQGAFTNPIALTCSTSGIPAGSVCSFTPPTVTPTATGSSVSSVLTVFIPTLAALPGSEVDIHPEVFADYVVLVFALFFSVGLSGVIFRRSKTMRLASRAFSLLALASLAACNSTHVPPPSETYTVTVTATSNQLVHTASVSLIVQ
jgi:hypothetical protein